MYPVRINSRPIAQVTELFDEQRLAALQNVAPSVRSAMRDQVVWNINTGITAGGASDMVQSMLSGIQALGVEAHWLTFDPEPEFLTISKRLHNFIYGRPGDGSQLTDICRAHYETVLRTELEYLQQHLNPGDIAILHDPQTAGLAPHLKQGGVKVVWRCHLGTPDRNEYTEQGWQFLQPYVEHVDALIVSDASYAPDFADPAKVVVMTPSIDGNSTRNVPLNEQTIADTLTRANILAGGAATSHVEFKRMDGATGAVRRHFDLVHGSQVIPQSAELVVQVSRWDKLKDMFGVLQSFAENRTCFDPSVHLALVGPEPTSDGFDPEAEQIQRACINYWEQLSDAEKGRIHIVSLPHDDRDESAHLVNALQRRANVIVQKSLVEGFGLTVAEALWKSKPVVASAVGGIKTQINHGVNGLLLQDPHDIVRCAELIAQVLNDPETAAKMGQAGRETVRENYLGDRHLVQFADLILRLS